MESRVEVSTDRILGILEKFHTVGTFFVLGIVAESHPDLIRRISQGGHELASHGWDHRRVTDLSPEEFRSQVRRSKAVLEDVSGRPVLGFRAPSFSIVRGREWALSILVEEGYRYDSSLYPVLRRGYGYRGGQRDIHLLKAGSETIIEVPPATLRLAGINIPAGGGGTFRQFPYFYTRAAFRNGAQSPPGPATFYLHPWELDPDQPRIPGLPLSTRVRHYRGLRQAESRLVRLLEDVQFQSIEMTLSSSDYAA
jgi:polysaccharide deacetylase family protein (PEP-CTERM system associated)